MAAAGLLALLDDIATILDDVAILTKASAKQTSGIVTDDLVVTAEQVSGVASRKEIPVILRVARGSLVNKAVLIPLALFISAVMPFFVTPLLLIGAAYLCYEAAEKIIEKMQRGDHHTPQEAKAHIEDMREEVAGKTPEDIAALEDAKVKTAIRTDFILSAEIIIIALGTIAAAPFVNQLVTLVVIALLMTVVVYGLVAALVKLDDLALFMISRAKGEGGAAKFQRKAGALILAAASKIMATLGLVGTLAMLLVGGGIVAHAFHAVEQFLSVAAGIAAKTPLVGWFLGAVTPSIGHILIGLVFGLAVIIVMHQVIFPALGKKPH